MKERANILVLGAGAIGGIVAALLHKNGHSVHLVTKHQEIADISNSKGLHIFGYKGSHYEKVPAVAKVLKIKVHPDFVFVATRATEMGQAVKDVLPFLHENCKVISLQNGIVEQELAEIVGEERTIGCSVGWGATMHDKGELEMTSGGEFVIGYLSHPQDKILLSIKAILENIVPVTISDNIMSDLYSKLIINSCISSLGAVSGLRLGQMLSKGKIRRVFLQIIEEAIMVSDAMNLKVVPYAGKLNYYDLLQWPTLKQHIFLMAFGFKYRKLTSSSLQSLRRGGKTEVLGFNGYIRDKGRELKIDTPVNTLVTEMVLEIEEQKREISPKNFNDSGFQK
jgi:2-dehydropantoate 2-reductase